MQLQKGGRAGARRHQEVQQQGTHTLLLVATSSAQLLPVLNTPMDPDSQFIAPSPVNVMMWPRTVAPPKPKVQVLALSRVTWLQVDAKVTTAVY